MSKHVCVMTSVHPPFDVRIFHKECRALVEAGYRVTLIVPHCKSLVRDGVRVKATPVRRGRLQRATLGVWDVLISALKEQADVYHFHDPELIPAGILLRLLGRKVVYDVHEDLPGTISYKDYLPRWIRKPLAYFVGAIEGVLSGVFSGIITATPFLAERFSRFNPKTSVVHNFPLLEEFQPSNSNRAPASSFVYVGMSITPQRGGRELVKAIDLVSDSAAAHLVLVGRFESAQFLDELRALPGWTKTSAQGYLDRDKLAAVLCEARAGLVTIHPEPNYLYSYPVKLFEYMACGIPLIASDFPCIRQLVDEARCGILVDPKDHREIAAAMNYLLEHPTEADAMGENGRSAILQKFNWTRERKNLLDVYDRLLFPATRPATAPTRQELP
jgi:glycosyltransferase involved in cell wall biosynthesis